ncbi:MAG: rhodanese-like domain-containing protein [Polaromonas sp.]|nr:rhodanese-like domain-containing protein [Polaromonas sp.]
MNALRMEPDAVDFIEATALKKELASGQELALVDVREQGQYGEGHPFHAVPLAYSRLELDAGRLIPNFAVSIVLLDDGGGDTLGLRAASRLQAMGYQQVRVLKYGASGWRAAGYTLFKGVHVPSKTFGELVESHCHTPRISPEALKFMMARGDDVVVLDGRSRSEYAKMNIPGAVCCPNAELAYRLHRLAPDKRTTVVVNCAGRTRSIIGAQSLINLGAGHPVFALENGTQGWYLKDYPLERNGRRFYPEVSATDSPLEAVRQKAAVLAQACGVKTATADQLRRWRHDRSRTTYFFDVRTPEEFKAGSAHGAVHAEGGQLLQGTDLYIGVRHARVVLYDTDGIRAPLIGSWLRQMGYDVCLLGIAESLTVQDAHVASSQAVDLPPLAELFPAQLRALDGAVQIVDLRSSMDFRAGHLGGAVWSTRSRIRGHVDAGNERHGEAYPPIVLVATHPQIAALAAGELSDAQRQRTRLLIADAAAWEQAGLRTEATPDFPADADCLDYLFFVHDRHEGNKRAATQYLEWEMNLVSQLDVQEKSSFNLHQAT